MARKKLGKLNGDRLKFVGKFERYGTKTGYKGFPKRTILLKDVRVDGEDGDGGKVVTDHLWFNYTKGFQNLGELNKGDNVQFQARVKEYIKGYVNYRKFIDEREIDFKLNYPTQIKKVD
jgi:hypothetical protein